MSSVNVHLNFKQIAEAVKQLSPADKLKLSQTLWEDDIIIPEEHKTLVLSRRKKARNNPERLLDWETASKKLRS